MDKDNVIDLTPGNNEVRVYEYAVSFRKGPDGKRTTVAPLVYDQLRAANSYYNKKIELENARREEWRKIRRECFPKLAEAESDYAAADALVASVRSEIKALKSSARTRKVDPDLASRLKENIAARSAKKKQFSEAREEYKALLSPADEEYKRRFSAAVPKKDNVHLIKRARKSILEDMLGEDLWPDFWKRSRKLDFNTAEAGNLARKESGLLKGTYDLVDDAFDQASKGTKDSIRFRRYSGGRVGVRISVPVSSVGSSDKSLAFRIDPLPEGTWDTRSGRRHAFTNVRLRFGRGLEDVVLPIMMHRPLPEGGHIKAVWLKEDRSGVRRSFFLQVTVEGGRTASSAVKPRKRADFVAINLAWRTVYGGLRAGYWVGSDGAEGEILLKSRNPDGLFRTSPSGLEPYREGERSRYLLDSLVYSSTLRSISDGLFHGVVAADGTKIKGIRDELLEEMKEVAFPPWMKGEKDMLQTLAQWRAPMRLVGYSRFLCEQTVGRDRMMELWREWREFRGVRPGDTSNKIDLMPESPTVVFEWASARGVSGRLALFSVYLEIWRRKHVHLYSWGVRTMERAMRARRELYRVLSKDLSGRYETLLIEDFDLRSVVEDSLPEEVSGKRDKVGLQRTLASTSILRSCAVQAFGPRHRKVDPSGNTSTHAGCGGTMSGKGLEMVCEKCGLSEDRDRNNCLNQIRTASGSHGIGSAKKPKLQPLARSIP